MKIIPIRSTVNEEVYKFARPLPPDWSPYRHYSWRKGGCTVAIKNR